MKDLKGRAYASVSETKAGSQIYPDGDFTCMVQGHVKTVQEDEQGLFVPCNEGLHYLAGQIQDGHYIGLYPFKGED